MPWALLGYLVFVIYGSLIPFEFRPITVNEAWEQLMGARYLNLGVQSRADWIANIVLYIPLSFLMAAWAHRGLPPQTVSLMRIAAVFFLCCFIAFGLEFLQVFVKPRTVSQNDLIAELTGSSIGIAVWYFGRAHLTQGLASLGADAKTAITAALWFYLISYVLLSLFPYDFVVSGQEMSWKLDTDRIGLFFASNACSKPLRCIAKLIAETMAVMPLGVLIALKHGNRRVPASRPLLYGCLLGLGIEMAQLLMASGVSQGVSVLTRGVGAVLGAELMYRTRNDGLIRIAGKIAPLLLLGFVPYVALLMSLNGWFTAPWQGVEDALAELQKQNFLPFYYHYFTSEASAMDSLLANAAIYAPFGLAYWIWGVARTRSASAASPAILAAVVAVLVEGGKLFMVGRHPDPTNVLIAAAAAALTYHVCEWLTTRNTAPAGPPLYPVAATHVDVSRPTVRHSGSPFAWAVFLVLSLLAAWAALRYPAGSVWLLIFLAGYAAVLWARPQLWLFAVPALLPVFDFATWSGWFFLTEYDLLLLVTVAVLVLRTEWGPAKVRLPRQVVWVLTAFFVAYVISLLRGLLPLQSMDLNAFSSYYSRYNAIRVGKGVLWALVLMPFVARAFQSRGMVRRYFVPGMLTGLAATALLIVYERWAFPGLLNLSSSFRATGFFSSMHVGGASVDAYLAMVLPFVTLLFLFWKNPLIYVAGLALYALGLHAFLVTFSRINYVALGAAYVLMLLTLARDRSLGSRYFAVALPLVLITVIVVVPLMSSPYTAERFMKLGEDAASRRDHWGQALALRRDDLASRLLGMGIGSFPRVYFWADPGSSRPASFAYLSEAGNEFLRLGSGKPLYILQRVGLDRDVEYRVTMDLRASRGARGITAMICEKPLLYSKRCESAALGVAQTDGGWQRKQTELVVRDYGRSGRSVYLVIYNPHTDTVIDVDNVSMRGPAAGELIRNGSFSGGNDRWFFTSDDHKSWRADNLWVHVLFEQGWLGVVTFGVLLIVVLKRLSVGAWQGDAVSVVLLASLVAGLVVGLVDSIVEAPRLTLLLGLLLFVALYHSEARTQRMNQQG